ncbi:hypothetical protein KFK09_028029 [Dendrobium nobile]|uniref:Uncharacterized protein n=1 Tax=Dendrobium nobile TaxID=94219 RepID=A0A8T3A2A9_DENNO|nr:hypothetical protein KFK09_028029 [Dendrobium nobile]
MDSKEGDDSSSAGSGSSQKPQTSRLSCTKYFDALWFCYSPFHQMEQYYRYGHFDNCSGKWSSLFDCLSLKTKRPDEVEKILQAREKSKSHIWTYRTVEEASENWWRMYHHLFDKSDTKPKPDA